jgi:hypothetical protein
MKLQLHHNEGDETPGVITLRFVVFECVVAVFICAEFGVDLSRPLADP